MNRIKDIRENYDLITEREEADVKKLTSLVRAGLFDAKKLPMLKRALEKNPDEMTVAERKVLLSLLDTLMSEVLHSQQVYSNVKRNVSHKDNVNEEQEELDEATKDYLSKFDPRFGTKQPSEQDLPTVLVLKRKGIRVYPDNQKVGLYYSQAIDRYISIPFGNVTFGINEDTITLNEKEKKSSNNASNSAEYYRRQLEKQRRKALSKVAEYSEKSAADLTKKQQNTAIKHAYKSAASQGDLEQLVNVGAYHLGAGIRRLLGGKHKAETQPGNEQSSTPEVKAIKPPEAVKPPEAKVVSAPEKVIPTKKFRKRKNPVAGAGEQPTGDFKFAEPFAKTKTASYSSAVAPARELSPLEKSSGNIDPKKQLPRKRYGFDTKVVGTGPQPGVGKTKLKATFQKKLSESRELNEQEAVAKKMPFPKPLTGGKAGLAAAIPLAVGVGTALYQGTKNMSFGAGKKRIKDALDTVLPRADRAGEETTAAKFDATKALMKRQRADERDAADIASSRSYPKPVEAPKVSDIQKKMPELPAAVTSLSKELMDQPTAKAISEPSAPVSKSVAIDYPADTTKAPEAIAGAVASATKSVSVPKDVEGVMSDAATKAMVQTKATSGTKTDANVATAALTNPRLGKDEEKKKPKGSRTRPKPRIKLPDFTGEPSDSTPDKFSQPLGFNLQAKTTKAGEFDPYDVRRERERQIYAKSLKEDEDTDRRTVSYKKISTPLQFKSDKLVKTTGPKQRTIRDVRSERERQIYNTQSSSDVVSELRNIKENNLKENYINISGNQILINNMVANKILQVYESLADSNKTKMNEMLNETTDSFKKILNFAVRQ